MPVLPDSTNFHLIKRLQLRGADLTKEGSKEEARYLKASGLEYDFKELGDERWTLEKLIGLG